MKQDLDTGKIREWRSIVTLVVFVLTNINVLFPFHIPVYIPKNLYNGFLHALSSLRVISARDEPKDNSKSFVKLRVPMNMVTAPLIADLFLLAIGAIGRREIHDGTIGTDNIDPLDIMVFFITLAYIAISIDASGLIRYLAFRVLKWGGKAGPRLFCYLYTFFFILGSFIGNDPIILSGTAFLAYMTRVSRNIVHPRAWIYTQFAVANIASAILVSSNPTNLVLTSAFNIKFIAYTANMVVPVVITGIVLLPFLVYIIFEDEDLIPTSIQIHDLPDDVKGKKPVNPNIPFARGHIDDDGADLANNEEGKLLSLEEIMNPFLDKGGAVFGAVIMAATLIAVLVLNAASTKTGKHPIFYITLPGAFVMFCWDIASGWYHRKETRNIARNGRKDVETTRAERAFQEDEFRRASLTPGALQKSAVVDSSTSSSDQANLRQSQDGVIQTEETLEEKDNATRSEKQKGPSEIWNSTPHPTQNKDHPNEVVLSTVREGVLASPTDLEMSNIPSTLQATVEESNPKLTTLVSIAQDVFRWLQETFPTATAVLVHLPFALIPFAFCMFILVQALVTKGWVPVFAYGWDHWVKNTGSVGAIGGMGFISVVLCNFAGTNIGTTILLWRVIQAWEEIHRQPNASSISDRTFWATVYAMALGVNYGAFSTSFSASLAGLLWRDILFRKHIRVRSLDFARVNLPIIAIAMIVGCTVLVAEVYIIRTNKPYDA
uniref:Citrate transporter-like domain-containing protein n=1 Tax=Bionectria ochroleuca TaxID=29856 RepID=A0A8H7K9I5_BIOOC